MFSHLCADIDAEVCSGLALALLVHCTDLRAAPSCLVLPLKAHLITAHLITAVRAKEKLQNAECLPNPTSVSRGIHMSWNHRQNKLWTELHGHGGPWLCLQEAGRYDG